MNEPERLLTIKELTVTRMAETRPELDCLMLAIDAGETVTILGEAGCGHDALMRVLSHSLDDDEIAKGEIRYGPQSGLEGPYFASTPVRVAYLPGPSSQPLSPHASAGSQLARIVARRLGAPLASGRTELAQHLQNLAGAPPPLAFDRRAGDLAPETLAWGLLAAALAQMPELLLVDHLFEELAPTEARALESALLDAKNRLNYTILCAAMRTETALGLRGRLIVMRRGQIVEDGPTERLASPEAHAYTQLLFRENTAPAQILPRERPIQRGQPVLQAFGAAFGSRFKNRSRQELSFELRRGASLALIGEAGSGREAIARAVLGTERLAAGRLVFDAVDIGILSAPMRARLRRHLTIIAGTDEVLDPRMTLWETIAEHLRAHLQLPHDLLVTYREQALRRVGLASLSGERTVASLSLFDRRRLQVARAISTAPVLAVIDEPFKGLDAFARSVMCDLLRSFRLEEGPAFLVITADISVARALADEAMIFYRGAVVDRGPLADLFAAPKHPYTRALIEAARVADLDALSTAVHGV